MRASKVRWLRGKVSLVLFSAVAWLQIAIYDATVAQAAMKEGAITRNFNTVIKPYIFDFLNVVTYCMVAYGVYKYIRHEENAGKDIIKKAVFGFIMLQFIDIGMDILVDIGESMRDDIRP